MKVAGISAAALTLGTGTVPLGAAQADQPTLTVDLADESLEVGETTTASFGLTEAPNGLVGFNIRVSVDTDVATIVGAAVGETFPDQILGEDVTVAFDDGAATIRSIDMNDEVGAGHADVDFGSVELEGVAAGETAVDVEVVRLEDDDDATVDPVVESATLAVESDPDSGGNGNGDENGDPDSGENGDGDSDDNIAELDPTATEVGTGDQIQFHVRDTTGNQHWITALQWDFGDGTTASGWWNAHSYDSPGTYTVALTATDNEGQETTHEVEITVS